MAAEKKLQDKVIADLESMSPKVLVFKLMKANINDLADVWFIHPKGTACVELKSPGKKPRPGQEAMLNRINATGGARAFWCDNWDGWMKIKEELMLFF